MKTTRTNLASRRALSPQQLTILLIGLAVIGVFVLTASHAYFPVLDNPKTPPDPNHVLNVPDPGYIFGTKVSSVDSRACSNLYAPYNPGVDPTQSPGALSIPLTVRAGAGSISAELYYNAIGGRHMTLYLYHHPQDTTGDGGYLTRSQDFHQATSGPKVANPPNAVIQPLSVPEGVYDLRVDGELYGGKAAVVVYYQNPSTLSTSALDQPVRDNVCSVLSLAPLQ